MAAQNMSRRNIEGQVTPDVAHTVKEIHDRLDFFSSQISALQQTGTQVGQVTLTIQSKAISPTIIVQSASAGVYQISFLLVVTMAGSSTLTGNALYTDTAKAETIPVLSAVSVAAKGTFSQTIRAEVVSGSNISYSVALGGSGAVWNLYITVDSLTSAS